MAAEVVSKRLNRRKIDLIPEPAWAEPPKARIGELLDAVTDGCRPRAWPVSRTSSRWRLAAARAAGLDDPRITSDVKHVEIGLTDKSDSARWAARWLAERGITGGLILVGGDEFGPLGGVPGSDSSCWYRSWRGPSSSRSGSSPAVSLAGVVHAAGRTGAVPRLLDAQLARRRDRRVPAIDDDPAWVVALPEERAMERAAEAIGTLANGWAGIRASPRGGRSRARCRCSP